MAFILPNKRARPLSRLRQELVGHRARRHISRPSDLTAARPDPVAEMVEKALADQDANLHLDREAYPRAIALLIKICGPRFPQDLVPLLLASAIVAPYRAARAFAVIDSGDWNGEQFTIAHLRKFARKDANARVALALIGHPYGKRLSRRERAGLLLRQLVRR